MRFPGTRAGEGGLIIKTGRLHNPGGGAIRGCGLAPDTSVVAPSVATGVAASRAALRSVFCERNVAATAAGGVVRGLSIAFTVYAGNLTLPGFMSLQRK